MLKLEDILAGGNLAEQLNDKQLETIGSMVFDHYTDDRNSRQEWEDAYSRWLDMAGQKRDVKNKPFKNCANIKYPAVTQAALTFNAKAVPALIPNAEPVGAAPIGPDPDGQKTKIARAVAKHMNHQIITEMAEWEEEMDSLLMALSISGMEYKKTYYDGKKKRLVSRHVTPLQLVVNYYATDLESARKTEVLRWNRNQIVEKINSGAFSDVDWEDVGDPQTNTKVDAEFSNTERMGLEEPSQIDSATPYVLLEYHGFYDLDDDGYEEPYIITILEHSQVVLQITPRFTVDNIEFNQEDGVISITPLESYTRYGFIPNPDGSFYYIGFGHILYPLNAAINTAINQTLDAGTLNNTNAGFLGRGAKIRGGMFNMSAGRWLNVNATGDDLRKSIVPMPKTAPSTVLMSLIQFLVGSTEKLSSTTDIFTGEHPGQNSKVGVTQAVRDEGSKVFTAIYKRARRSLKQELDKLFSLNGIVLNSGQDTLISRSAEVFGVTADLYANTSFNIQPSADPNIAIKEQKMEKDMMIMQTIQQVGMGNLQAAVRNLFVTMEVEDVDVLLPEDSQPAGDPKMAIKDMEIKLAQEKMQLESDIKLAEMKLEADIANSKLKLEELSIKVDILKVGQASDAAGLKAGVDLEKIEVDIKKTEQMQAAPAAPMGGAQQ